MKNDQFGLPHSWHWKVRSSAFSSGKVGLKATKSDCPVQYWQAIGVMQPYNGERASLVGAVASSYMRLLLALGTLVPQAGSTRRRAANDASLAALLLFTYIGGILWHNSRGRPLNAPVK
ncbi:MAG TPA: hypothetical protein VE970_10690 [Pseudolabrys sp.]|nr:hypothetical protein [Pseudolabrys sp.]